MNSLKMVFIAIIMLACLLFLQCYDQFIQKNTTPHSHTNTQGTQPEKLQD